MFSAGIDRNDNPLNERKRKQLCKFKVQGVQFRHEIVDPPPCHRPPTRRRKQRGRVVYVLHQLGSCSSQAGGC